MSGLCGSFLSVSDKSTHVHHGFSNDGESFGRLTRRLGGEFCYTHTICIIVLSPLVYSIAKRLLKMFSA